MVDMIPISVDVDLPDNDKLCVLYCQGGAYDQLRWIDLGYYSGGKWYLTSTDIDNDNERITHWLPVPSSPEETSCETKDRNCMSTTINENRIVQLPVDPRFADQIMIGLAHSEVAVWAENTPAQFYVCCEIREENII